MQAIGETRLPPHNLEAEESVLGALLLDRDAIIRVAATLKPEDFYRGGHAAIYRVILDLYNRREPPDLLTVAAELERRDELANVGGVAALTALIGSVPTAVHVEYYGQIVERTAILRRIIAAGTQIVNIGYNERLETDEALDAAQRAIHEVAQGRSGRDFISIAEVLEQYFDKLDFLQQHRGEVVGVPTGFQDLDQLTGGFQKSDLVILAARPGVGKCVAADTPMVDPRTGEWLTAAELYRRGQAGEPVSVWSLTDAGKLTAATPSAYVDDGIKPVYRVRTRLGREIKTTLAHPFLTPSGWVALADLAVGARVAVPRALPVFGDEPLPEAEIILLAYLIGDGTLTHFTPMLTTVSPAIVEDLERQAAALGLHITHSPSPNRAPSYRIVAGRWKAHPLKEALVRHGLWGKRAHDKAVPPAIYRLPREGIALFLNRLFATDGTAYTSVSGGKTIVRISYATVSKELATGVQHLLLRFGINARLRERQVKYKDTTRRAFEIELTDSADLKRFAREIGIFGKEEAVARVLVHLEGRAANPNRDTLPIETWQAILVAKGERSWRQVSVSAGKPLSHNWHVGKRAPNRSTVTTLARVLDAPALLAQAEADIYWDTIVAIEPAGEEQVYDLTVPVTHNFVAADFYVHNTSFSLGLAYNAALHGKTVAVFNLEMPAEQLVQRLLSMETGIDSHRLRLGHINDEEWESISRAFGKLSELQIYIDDTPGIGIMELRSKARRLQAERGLDFVQIDYLQLMQGSRRGDNRVQEVSEISRGLKGLARELNVPVLSMAQLSRSVESRSSHIPMLSDLRESGCLAGDTEVFLPDLGGYRRIDQLVGQTGFNVLALDTATWSLEPRPVTAAFATGRKPVYRLRTRLGRTIRATGNHQFLTIEGWRRLDDLAPGMRLALPRRLPSPAGPTMRDAELALLGHLIGDGCTLARQPIHYTTVDHDLAETVADLATQVFGDAVKPRISPERGWIQVYLSAGHHLTHGIRNPIAAWLDGMGIFDLRSHEKRVPDQVFMQPAEGIAVFLRHLWATDGCFWCSTNPRRAPKMYYATSSLALAEDVRSLLLRLGINATILRVPQTGKGRDQWHVDVTGTPDQAAFIAQVGAVGARKSESLAAVRARLEGRVSNTNRDVLPREVWKLHAIPAMQTAGVTARQMQAGLGNAYCGTGLYKQNVSRARAFRLAEVVKSDDLSRLARSDVYWDEIVAIEPDGEEEVYDLTVEGLHNFVANDIVVHNSIEQDADMVVFIYREELYDPETEKKGLAELHIAKHRNGPLGVVNLRFFEKTTRFADLELYREPDL